LTLAKKNNTYGIMNIAKEIIQRFGGRYELAKAMGFTHHESLKHWERTGVIPARRQIELLRLARERGVDLAPEDFFPKDVVNG
jgi:hypothetical protein